MMCVKPEKTKQKTTNNNQVPWWAEWVCAACWKSSMLYQSMNPIKLEYTAPVQQWFHTGCSNETFWQEALLTQSYCHLNCLLLTKHAHQHYPQNISAASSVTKISAQKEFQKGSNPKTITMIKGHWMGNLRNQKRLFMHCSSFLPAKSLTAFWLNSHGPQITFMLHLFWLRKQILK